MIRRCLLIAVPLVLAAGAASAEIMITPFAGTSFGGQTQRNVGTYGVGVGFLGGGVFGFEAEFSWAPDFFGDSATATNTSTNHVQSLDFNLLLALPIGVVRLYGAGGVGVIGSKVTSGLASFDFSNTNAGFNAGGGLIIGLGKHFGLRGDIRYFRTFGNLAQTGDFTIQELDYWRGVGGLVFRF
jgi:hypothetical protein